MGEESAAVGNGTDLTRAPGRCSHRCTTLRISAHVGHRFRPMSDTDFGASRTPVSLDVGHLSGGGALDN